MPKSKATLLAASSLAVLMGIILTYKVVKAYTKFNAVKSLRFLSAPKIPRFEVKIISSYPHDKTAFTEGLEWHTGHLYESTGIKGKSTLKKVDLPTGKPLKTIRIDTPFFTEGLTIFRGKVYQLTWKSQRCLVYDADSLKKTGEFTYEGEGWGLTHDAEHLIMSDGSHRLRFIDPESFKTVRVLEVRMDGTIVGNLNELEFIEGMIYANVYITNSIVRIDPSSGNVTGLIDLTPLYEKMSPLSLSGINMPNGIAYDPETRAIYVTGKFWPKLFRVKIVPRGVSDGR